MRVRSFKKGWSSVVGMFNCLYLDICFSTCSLLGRLAAVGMKFIFFYD